MNKKNLLFVFLVMFFVNVVGGTAYSQGLECDDCLGDYWPWGGGSVQIVVEVTPGIGDAPNDYCDPEDSCGWESGCNFRGTIEVYNGYSETIQLFDTSGNVMSWNGPNDTDIGHGQTKEFTLSVDMGCGQKDRSMEMKNLAGEVVGAEIFSCSSCVEPQPPVDPSGGGN